VMRMMNVLVFLCSYAHRERLRLIAPLGASARHVKDMLRIWGAGTSAALAEEPARLRRAISSVSDNDEHCLMRAI
jgi:hypothetical protein